MPDGSFPSQQMNGRVRVRPCQSVFVHVLMDRMDTMD